MTIFDFIFDIFFFCFYFYSFERRNGSRCRLSHSYVSLWYMRFNFKRILCFISSSLNVHIHISHMVIKNFWTFFFLILPNHNIIQVDRPDSAQSNRCTRIEQSHKTKFSFLWFWFSPQHFPCIPFNEFINECLRLNEFSRKMNQNQNSTRLAHCNLSIWTGQMNKNHDRENWWKRAKEREKEDWYGNHHDTLIKIQLKLMRCVSDGHKAPSTQHPAQCLFCYRKS